LFSRNPAFKQGDSGLASGSAVAVEKVKLLPLSWPPSRRRDIAKAVFSTSGAEMAVVSMGECPFPREIHRLVTQIKSK
jgi:hypothetical protein